MDVLEDLLEALTVAGGAAFRQIRERRIAAVADELEIGAAAEHVRQAAQDHDTRLGIACELQAGAAKVLRRFHVELVESRRTIDRDRTDAAGPVAADVGHANSSSGASRAPC